MYKHLMIVLVANCSAPMEDNVLLKDAAPDLPLAIAAMDALATTKNRSL